MSSIDIRFIFLVVFKFRLALLNPSFEFRSILDISMLKEKRKDLILKIPINFEQICFINHLPIKFSYKYNC